jgi:hypothetical protein
MPADIGGPKPVSVRVTGKRWKTPDIPLKLNLLASAGKDMFWLESHSVPVIGAIVFAAAYAVAALIFFGARWVSRGTLGPRLRIVSPGTLTPLGAILGLLIAFLSARVWTNVDRAGAYVSQEATALRKAVVLSNVFPSEPKQNVRRAIKDHISFIETQDWPAMSDGRARMDAVPVNLVEAMNATLAFSPKETPQQLAQNRTLIALETALEARRHRLRISREEIAPVQWAVVVIPAICILVTIALLHLESRPAKATTMFLFSTAVATSLLLLLTYDRPFGSGGFFIEPTLLKEVMPN